VAFWWVNQKQTWRFEIPGEYLWSPKLDKRGRHLQYYDNMVRLAPRDIVFSYINGVIQFVGVVVRPAETNRRPDFGFATNTQWNEDGWSVEMRYMPISHVRPQEHLEFYRQVAPEKHGPMNRDGVVPSQYLFSIPDSLGTFYLGLAGTSVTDVTDLLRFDQPLEGLVTDTEEVTADPRLTSTERRQLVRARLGQGLFKEEVRLIEPSCRLTGLSEPRHLVASHMKPWRQSTNAERLDGNNGLLLSPHVDHLFDRGLITFDKVGQVITSGHLNPIVPKVWKLDLGVSGRKFRKSQLPYLEYHQDQIFRSA
jgi:hypothetical protein